MKAIGDTVKLRYRTEWGDPPGVDDVLVTRTGRCYLIREVRGRVHRCTVVPADVTTPGRRFSLVWDKRRAR